MGTFTLCDGTTSIPRFHIQGAIAIGKWLKMARTPVLMQIGADLISWVR